MTQRLRVRAAALTGEGGWLNTGGKQLDLADLRGKIVILDFWTFCCVNCLHVLDELRPLEEKYKDVLVVIGVHSPKFVHEADHDAVIAAVERYEVHHPVLDDPKLSTWQSYAVRAWPTLAVIDPEGYVVAQHSGEGHAHALDRLIEELVNEHEAKGTLHRGDGPYVAPPASQKTLHFPAKVLNLRESLLVADAGSHRVLETSLDGETLIRAIGTGERGLHDGTSPQFSEPNGLCTLPEDVARQVGYDIVIADTVNHALRGLNLATGQVTTVAGTGEQWMQGDGPGYSDASACETRLSSPWDVVWFPAINAIAIAMAGIHQLWSFDPVAKTVRVLAGTTNEGMVDGNADKAWFAQTSGLAVSQDGQTLWIADSETSSLRRLTNGVVHSEIGKGLFDFGHVDGAASDALLQHPLGVAVLPDDSVVIADTYNKAIRHFDPNTKQVTTVMRDVAEPSGFALVADESRVDLLVVESATHSLTRIRLADKHQHVQGDAYRTQRPATEVAPGAAQVRVVFTPPSGQKLDDRYGPSTHLVVSSSPPELLLSGAGSGSDLTREITIADLRAAGVTQGVLHVSVRAASCDIAEENEFPACHVHQQDWGVPIALSDEGTSDIALMLAGLA
jgi:thiol-disulfide isomerase/thioredoxin/sugar lactone lactonase YvrE